MRPIGRRWVWSVVLLTGLWVASVAAGATLGPRADVLLARHVTLALRPEPEPASLAMLGTGLLALAVGALQRRRQLRAG